MVGGGNARNALHTRVLQLRFTCAPNKRAQLCRIGRKISGNTSPVRVTSAVRATGGVGRAGGGCSALRVCAATRGGHTFTPRTRFTHTYVELYAFNDRSEANFLNLFPVATANSCRRPPRRRYARSRGVPANPITWSPEPGISEGSVHKPSSDPSPKTASLAMRAGKASDEHRLQP